MNVDTMHLMRVANEASLLAAKGYMPVPSELQADADRLLGERSEVTVRSGPLAKWAKAKREERRKQAAASRRQNRR